MVTPSSRYNLSGKERKKFIKEVNKLYPFLERVLCNVRIIELVKFKGLELYLVENRALFFKLKQDDRIYPTLINLLIHENIPWPSVTVDEGAVPYIRRGADVMRPGIVKVEGDFVKGDVVAVKECKYGKPIALGLALHTSEELLGLKRGRVIRNLHYLGDDIWNMCIKFSNLR
ncbi:MAG: hypothetical protein B6U69_03410 [Thermofilum sp. ex4484_15]|nr:MAG: hypothetical protein B6U69_03410 [Thermofilum sp. ex4484_15]